MSAHLGFRTGQVACGVSSLIAVALSASRPRLQPCLAACPRSTWTTASWRPSRGATAPDFSRTPSTSTWSSARRSRVCAQPRGPAARALRCCSRPRSAPADLKANLAETDYGNFLQNEVRRARGVCDPVGRCFRSLTWRRRAARAPQSPPLTPSVVRLRAQDKFAKEFEYLRSSSVEPLTTFLDYVRCVPGRSAARPWPRAFTGRRPCAGTTT